MKLGTLLVALSLCLTGITYAAGTMVVDSFVHPDPRIGKRYVQVYLPEGYDPGTTTRYPVIYFLHGAKDGVGPGYANHVSYPYMKGILDAMIGNGVIEPVVMAKPNAQSTPYVVSWHSNSILNGPWESYTYSSIVDFVESHYKAVSDPDCRYLMGHSAGGYGAMRAAYKHPAEFSALAAHSLANADAATFMRVGVPLLLAEYPEGPPYHWHPARGFLSAVLFSLGAAWTPNLLNPPFYVDLALDSMANYIPEVMDVWLAQSPAVLAQSMPPGTHVRTYFDCGLYDDFLGYAPCCTLSAKLGRLGFEHEYQTYVGGHFDSLPTRFPVGIAFLVGIKATPVFEPAVLNLKSRGRFVTCYVELPAPYSAADIDPGTVVIDRINGEELDPPLPAVGPHAVGDWDDDEVPDLMVKFDRQALVEKLVELGFGPGDEVTLRVAGELESQIPFRDVGMLKIVGGGKGAQADRFPIEMGLDLKSAGTGQGAVQYSLPCPAHVRLLVYDATGRLVAKPVDEMKAAGLHRAGLGGMTAGVYIVRLDAGGSSATTKLVRTE
ncbi:T9SS type A sorting domain-containing protein [candidate division WOR-3 bacterium]|nr:T9SS type A sorting domain-containing protein [candidate division WOR-3 bacterium]